METEISKCEEQKYTGLEFEKAERYAKDHNLKIVLPRYDELHLDYDNTLEIPTIFNQTMNVFEQHYVVGYVKKAPSKSGNGLHVTIKVNGARIRKMERIAWQAVFGSDPKREALSILRIKQGNPHPTLFYEKE